MCAASAAVEIRLSEVVAPTSFTMRLEGSAENHGMDMERKCDMDVVTANLRMRLMPEAGGCPSLQERCQGSNVGCKEHYDGEEPSTPPPSAGADDEDKSGSPWLPTPARSARHPQNRTGLSLQREKAGSSAALAPIAAPSTARRSLDHVLTGLQEGGPSHVSTAEIEMERVEIETEARSLSGEASDSRPVSQNVRRHRSVRRGIEGAEESCCTSSSGSGAMPSFPPCSPSRAEVSNPLSPEPAGDRHLPGRLRDSSRYNRTVNLQSNLHPFDASAPVPLRTTRRLVFRDAPPRRHPYARPSQEDVDEFFKKMQNDAADQFQARWNFDVRSGVPLTGPIDWSGTQVNA